MQLALLADILQFDGRHFLIVVIGMIIAFVAGTVLGYIVHDDTEKGAAE